MKGCCKKKKVQAAGPPPKRRRSSNPCRAGICRCWYCFLFILPLFWICAMLVFGFSLYYAIKYAIDVPKGKHKPDMDFLLWGTVAYSLIYVVVIQMTYLFSYFECIGKLARFLFAVLFAGAFIVCLVVIAITIVCVQYCPKGKNSVEEFYGKTGSSIPLQHVEILILVDRIRKMAILCALFMVLTLHIYLINILKFLEEKKLRDMRHPPVTELDAERTETETGITQNAPDGATGGMKTDKYEPSNVQMQPQLADPKRRDDFKLYYFAA